MQSNGLGKVLRYSGDDKAGIFLQIHGRQAIHACVRKSRRDGFTLIMHKTQYDNVRMIYCESEGDGFRGSMDAILNAIAGHGLPTGIRSRAGRKDFAGMSSENSLGCSTRS